MAQFITTSKGVINTKHICTLAPDEDLPGNWIITLSGGDCLWLPEAEAKDIAAKLLQDIGVFPGASDAPSQEEN